jgi:hypothetical protein
LVGRSQGEEDGQVQGEGEQVALQDCYHKGYTRQRIPLTKRQDLDLTHPVGMRRRDTRDHVPVHRRPLFKLFERDFSLPQLVPVLTLGGKRSRKTWEDGAVEIDEEVSKSAVRW